jgi:hypothetical protein
MTFSPLKISLRTSKTSTLENFLKTRKKSFIQTSTYMHLWHMLVGGSLVELFKPRKVVTGDAWNLAIK